MLATFVKLAYKEDFATAEVTSSQFIYGIIGIVLINLFQRTKTKNTVVKASPKTFSFNVSWNFIRNDECFLLFSGKIHPVSIGIVLLMQTVWMGCFIRMVFR